MRFLLSCIILFFILLNHPLLSEIGEINGVNYEFNHNDNYYSFRSSFSVKAKPDCLISLIYNFKNISNYTLGTKSIVLVRQGYNWIEVTYSYRKLFIFENTSTWRRILDRDNHKIVFEMQSSKNNMSSIPQMISSTGYYRIMPEAADCRLEYYQECKLKPGRFQNMFFNKAKKEAIDFSQALKTYLDITFNE